mmetsp:Transcript_128/g.151  ORF Transcript_128/g.151 Transcript_128/m.151 type:complete len:85 (+) Transcript_128:155-409(+)
MNDQEIAETCTHLLPFSLVQKLIASLGFGQFVLVYNSRKIPLSMFFKVFYIPVVYTYTEESKSMSKALFICARFFRETWWNRRY